MEFDSTPMDDFDEFEESDSLYIEPKETRCKVLTSNQVADKMNAEINLICDSLKLPPSIVRILFVRYKWDKNKLQNKYFDMDMDAFFLDAGIINPLKRKACTRLVKPQICGICCDATADTGLQCGHKFCDSCIVQHLTWRINDGTESTIPCADTGCNIIIVDVEKFLTDPEVISKYNRLILKNFVQCNRDLYWCPSPGCIYIIETDDKFVTCKCKQEFCTGCYKEWHAPIICKLLQIWKKEDEATQHYLNTNTKNCPKCECSIEKNGGCPHMTCKQCRHEFCWKCLKPWLRHDGSYKCKSPEETEAIQKSRSLVERMKYCWDRYLYNKKALEDEQNRFNIDWEEIERHLSDLKDRVQILYKCRRFLMYSYAFIYYLEEDNRVYLLESNLDDLEAKTDKLTVNLEKFFEVPDMDSDEPLPNKEEIRVKVIDNAVHCERLREKWLEDIEKNQEEGSWVLRDR